MLTFSLNLQWDNVVDRWTIVSSQLGEPAGDPDDVTDIHMMNMAMSQIIKIYEALDAPIMATTLKVVPGQTVANTISANVLS